MRQSKEGAFREFAEARMGHLFRSACLLTGGDTHLAEDLVQETLGRMYVIWGRTSRLGNPAAYAQTVLVRCYLGHRRRRSAGERPSGELPDRPGESAGDASLRMTLLDALRELPPKDRAVIVLRYWEDRSVSETADALHVSSAAVRTRSTRALARLREQLGGSIGELAVR
ncbi:SigE family RNA polymerase sigma factor [Streptomyces poriferorum]|uniref:SigE family RNA polymerase sigma factor n=1 Tax=Streptomyces poriferorum TaxID=2798799 RepID=A0ABY9IRC9_9ACTN|nr:MULTISPECIES: SigE family RNA polymerase sigma factor [unclassified Streptomyces]WSQ45326.1 SigE family RNA polymerase sigma factor [Streptomyces sp. NBC_01220]MDP5313083.1 SigE family RNA polymerase sigma factor [Streptomyces sp. Alt4]WLQ49400.1 SigE family RNA polymerase sigma factor [Streptomyces sp. Alt1]WLQ57918.1 SigE family RNA polymerase sigma factor [Streptomyces sp. Alt2]WSI64221.1 SigE family RNA polymerase sigma factor [Streptomyces sp. NBC_01336]